MEKYENEKIIIGHSEPISFKKLEDLKQKSENSTCIIKYIANIGTGFFFKYNIRNSNRYFLITNEHILNNNSLDKKNTEIIIIYKKKEEKIKLDNTRLKFSNKQFDYSIIEILKTDVIFKKIKDKDYFEIDNYIMDIEAQKGYLNQDICIVQYPYGKELCFAQGRINRFNNYKIEHTVSTKNGSSGSPILIQNSFKVIGLHKGGIKNKDENIGIFFKDILTDFKNNISSTRPLTPLISSRKSEVEKNESNNKIKKRKSIINKDSNKNSQIFHRTINNFVSKKKANCIICKYNINKLDDIQILNCYDEVKNDKSSFWDWNIIDANENEKEIKENFQIILNEKQIDFCFKKILKNLEKIQLKLY